MKALEEERRFAKPLLYGICPACKGNLSVWENGQWIANLLPRLGQRTVQKLAWDGNYFWSSEEVLTCSH